MESDRPVFSHFLYCFGVVHHDYLEYTESIQQTIDKILIPSELVLALKLPYLLNSISFVEVEQYYHKKELNDYEKS